MKESDNQKDELGSRFRAAAARPRGLIVIEKEPVNLEMPFGSLDTFLTPNDRFYVRCHFPIPKINRGKWRLKVDGEVRRHLSLKLADLRAMPAHTVTSLLECAGNGRVFLTPKVKGAQWQLGAVGNASWKGVRVADVLREAGPKDSALEVVLEGADHGEIKDPPRPAGDIHYARSLPLGKALDDVILAYEMNGEPLSEAHGAPLRVIVPGWYGMASVKWLTRILVTSQPFQGFYQTIEYTVWQRERESLPVQVPLNEVPVKSQISRPEVGEVIPKDTTVWIQGAAWTSGSEIVKVEVSDDEGKRWHKAKLLGGATKNAWQFWEYPWKTPRKTGKRTLLVRATDARGRTQPFERDLDRGTYMINHSLPIEVEIR